MTPSDVAESYDALAHLWSSADFPSNHAIPQHERAITFARSKRRALDIGCGSSGRIVDLLASHGFDVEGLDVSPRMVELARQRHPHVAFHCADICEWERGLDGPAEKVDTAMGPPMYYSTLGIARTLQVLAEAGCLCRHLEYDQYPELHLYVIAQREQ